MDGPTGALSKLTRLTDTGVRRLDNIFSPPGIPLVRKLPHGALTTSICVRGGAGCGKTTLALALALAIARETQGTVLHLTTELDPVEVHLKARQLGIPDSAVAQWGTPETKDATVLATHLELHTGSDTTKTPSERKHGSLQLVWDLLHPGGAEQRAPDDRVQVVVIDAFAAPQPEESQDALRRDLVTLVQAMEGEGVSVILVEETLNDAPSWIPFVVDIVFELAWTADGDTGELMRKLRCTKSRHAVARPGPHSYGLEGRALTVWPDVLMATEPELKLRLAEPLRMAHMVRRNRYAVFTEGGVLLAEDDKYGERIETVVRCTPGAHRIFVRCGALTTIEDPHRGVSLRWTEDKGISALGWTLIELLRERGNIVIFEQPHLLMRRAHEAPGVVRLIDTLRGMGGIVVLSGPAPALSIFSGLSSFPQGENDSRLLRLTDQHYRTTAWRSGVLAMLELLEASSFASEVPKGPLGSFEPKLEALKRIESYLRSAAPSAHNDQLKNDLSQIAKGVPVPLDDRALLARWAIGARGEPSPIRTLAGVLVNLLLGYEQIAYDHLYFLSSEPGSPRRWKTIFWDIFAGTLAGNRQALQGMRSIGQTPAGARDARIVRDFLLRAVNAFEGEKAIDEEISASAWDGDRKAAARLEARMMTAESTIELPVLASTVMSFALQRSTPVLLAADLLYNLGLTAERLDNRPIAAQAYKAALRSNALLEEAQKRLERIMTGPVEIS